MTPPRHDAEGLTVTLPSATEVKLSRTFDAPRTLVFDAFTRPELLRRWHGAKGWRLVVCEITLRPGGSWRFVSHGPGGAELGHGGVFLEVEPPARLVQTETYDGWEEGAAVVTTLFEEHDGRTAMTTTVRYPSQEARDSVLRTRMERGVGEAYDRLAELLAETTERTTTQ
ncbi:SRPBCC family protein [Spongiactinospora sp. TRM90649]|uniref:SRPBCC family protein n=1 Tax=Spongiactinospora sp. TRM90649 TaxID=3031114 RepID=UPI0023F6D74D|nr:SRPBCC family protein [Spongiactinospora sp. TRM90649]MDF5751931.1 SRPBCC family protein [Spongiactinospora sp. TRM90649]